VRRPVPFMVCLAAIAPMTARALDSNGNGMSDVWELLHHQLELFPDASPFGPLEDADGDGLSNLVESIAGTDPFSVLPPLGMHGMEIASAPWPPDTFRLTVPWSLPGKTYTLSTSPDLSLGSWTPFDPMAGTGSHLIVDVSPQDAQTNALAERNFFRCGVADQPNPGGVFSPWELAVMADNPLIHAAIMALANPPGGGNPPNPEEPPVIPDSDGSGPADPYDASPFDDRVDWYRTPEAKYLHIPVDGSTGGFRAVDVSDSGRILLTRIAPVTDYETDPVGLVWDPSATGAGRLIPVMFRPENFELNFKVTAWNPAASSSFSVGTPPLPGPNTPSTRSVTLTVVMKAIAVDGSVIADVDYALSEHAGNSEQPTRSGHARLAFLWQQEQYGLCKMLGENRGYLGSVESPLVTEDHAVGFHTSGASPVTHAVHTHQIRSTVLPDNPSHLSVPSWSTTDLTPGYGLQGHPDHKPGLPPEPQITRSGRILIKNRVSASEINHILCGTATTLEVPSGIILDSISDLPDGPGGWGVGQLDGPFRFRSGGEFEPIASLNGVLAFDRQGNGIGNGAQGRAIWRNARWHTLEAATGVSSLAGMKPRKITPSGLVWISNAASGDNALLIPVEVVVPALNHDELEIDDRFYGAEELKVAKMERSLDENGVLDIDADPHRFHVRIPSRLGGVPVTAKLGTSGNPEGAYNDPAMEIPLTANPFQQESQSQLLVSDEVDDNADGQDEQVGDRTHRIQLGGDVEIGEIKIGAMSYPLGMKVPVKVRKRIEGKIIMVGSASMDGSHVTEFKKIAKERYAQIGVDFDLTITSMDVPDGIDETNVLFDNMPGISHSGKTAFWVHDNVKKLVDKSIADNKRSFITVFFVVDIEGNSARGFALRKGRTHPDDILYSNVAVISARETIHDASHKFTLAHEVGHIITDAGHYGIPDSSQATADFYGDGSAHQIEHNLMRNGTSGSNTKGSTKRLYIKQQKMIADEFLSNP
jgi:hypothetical protein